MLIRRFELKNELGEIFDLTDLDEMAFLNTPSGLGYVKSYSFNQIKNKFKKDRVEVEQSSVQGTLLFRTYEKYTEFVHFVEKAEELTLIYSIPQEDNTYEVYTKKVVLNLISKSEKGEGGVLWCEVTLLGLENWRKEAIYISKKPEGLRTTRWDFNFDAYLSDYSNNSFMFENTGHSEAEFTLDILGGVENPTIKIENEKGEVITEISIQRSLGAKEILKYSTVDGDNYIYVESGKKKINLFQDLDITKKNFEKLKKGINIITVTGDNEINHLELKIYPEFITI